jgi:hypothetical protein
MLDLDVGFLDDPMILVGNFAKDKVDVYVQV